MAKSKKKITRNPDIVWRCEMEHHEIEESITRGEDVSEKGTVVLVVSDMIHELNFIGGKIWMFCDGTNTEEDIVTGLLKIFDVEKSRLKQDVHEFISQLIQNGWLHYV